MSDTGTPLEKICGQFIFAEFMSTLAREIVGSIGGDVQIRAGSKDAVDSFGLHCMVLEVVVDDVV